MEDLFRNFWWLMFPMAWFIVEGWNSWLKYQARRDALKLIQAYAEKGQTPPPELLGTLSGVTAADPLLGDLAATGSAAPSATNWGWYQVALFGGLAGGFVFLARSNILGDEGLGDAMMVAAVVLGALALASLVYAITWKRPRG